MTKKCFTVEEYAEIINEALEKNIYSVANGQEYIVDAMKYSVMNGGKRIRPLLVLEFCRVCGGNVNNAVNFACAIEMVHSYSLIHDDLPCMDNDDMRRGKPSCHKAFGEEYALLAGDGLLTLAFETAVKGGEGIMPENKLKAVRLLAELAGIKGMVGGQTLDLKSEGQAVTLEQLRTIDSLKTGALIKASALLGCLAANATDEKMLSAAEKYAESIGIAFQIVDDILDVTSDSETLGKPVGSDEKNEKSTYVSLMGIEKSKQTSDELTNEAVKSLEIFGENAVFLKELALSLADRKK